MTDRNTLKQWFVRGAKPLATQFAAWIDSFWHKDDAIPANKIEGLQEAMNEKASQQVVASLSGDLTAHKSDSAAHTDIRGAIDAEETARENADATLESNKVDKLTAGATTRAYTHAGTAQGEMEVSMFVEPSTIAQRDTDGRVNVASGTISHHAVNYTQLKAETERAIEVEGALAPKAKLIAVLTGAEFSANTASVTLTFSVYNATTDASTSQVLTVPIASGTNPGLMPKESYSALVQALADIAALQQQGGKFIGTSFATKADMEDYEFAGNDNPGDFTFVQDDEDNDGATTRYIITGVKTPTDTRAWELGYVIEYDPIGLATAVAAGLVKGTAATTGNEGKVFVEADGTMSVIGWDDVVTAIGNLSSLTTAAKSNLVAAINEIKGSIPTTLPPSGAAGGDLSGTYPAPTIADGKVTDAKIGNRTITATASDTETLTGAFTTLLSSLSGRIMALLARFNSSTGHKHDGTDSPKVAYSDLSGTPAIPAAQVNSDWNATDGVAKILNKPDILVIPPALTGIAIKNKDNIVFSQADLTNYDKYICAITGDTASLSFTGDLIQGKVYTLVIRNTGVQTLTVHLPAVDKFDLADYMERSISSGYEVNILLWYDGANRRWAERAYYRYFGKYEPVYIGGVGWSPVSLIADPADITGMTSIFADRPDMLTSLYQFNRKKAWSPVGSVVDYSTTSPPEGDWAAENSPCPDGWRIPTKEDFELLATFSKQWVSKDTVGNAISGMFVGDNAGTATILDPKGCIFLPEIPYRTSGEYMSSNSGGFFWQSKETPGDYSVIYWAQSHGSLAYNNFFKFFALSVRPVKVLLN